MKFIISQVLLILLFWGLGGNFQCVSGKRAESILDAADGPNRGWVLHCNYVNSFINYKYNCNFTEAKDDDTKIGFWSNCDHDHENQQCELTYTRKGPVQFVKYTAFRVRYMVGPDGNFTVYTTSKGLNQTLFTSQSTYGNWRSWSYQFMDAPNPNLVSLL